MPKNRVSGKAGTYVLMAEEWHKPNEDGSYTIFEKGEEVELTAAEATRFFAPGSARLAFKSKEDAKKDFKTAAPADDSTVLPGTPENEGVGGGTAGNPINPGSRGPGSPR